MSTLTLAFASGAELPILRASAAEGLSMPFVLSLVGLSPDASLDLGGIVGQAATFTAVAGQAHVDGAGPRTWTGVVRRAEQLEAVSRSAGQAGASTYRFELVPRLWLMSQRRGYVIHQHTAIPDIAERLLADARVPFSFEIDRGRYPKLEYKVQYGEPYLDFFSRLLEEAGIAYALEDGDGQPSTVVLSDGLHRRPLRAGGSLRYVDNPSEAAERAFVTRVHWRREVHPGARVLRDYDFRNPARALLEAAPRTPGVEGRLEQYEYDAGAFLAETGRDGGTPVADDQGAARYDADLGATLAEASLDAMRVGARAVSLETNAYDLRPGAIFCVDGHPHAALAPARRLLVTKTWLSAEREGEWRMRVEAVPADVAYRPPARTRKPIAHGFQSATVVGPAGQEIHVDELGRVRVQFPWDRDGRSDEHSSSWVRVHEGWGGLGYGMATLPRIGQEVLVTFLQGDPDQPLVIGRAYNAVQQVPYKLPQHKTRSTWKSDSSLGSGGFNEILFEDLEGQELVWQQAEKDRERLVKDDERATVGHDRSLLVKNDVEERTVRDRRRYTGKDDDYVLKGERRERIERDSHRWVHGHALEHVGGSRAVHVLGDRDEEVGRDYVLRTGQATHLAAGRDLVGEAPDVTVRGPGGFLRLDKSGVTISGVLVEINVGGSPGVGAGARAEAPRDAPQYEREQVATTEEGIGRKRDEDDACVVGYVELACSHGQGLRLPPPEGAPHRGNLLEVVAGDDASPEIVAAKVEHAKPRCHRHESHTLEVRGPSSIVEKAERASEVPVTYGDAPGEGLAAWIWPWNAPPVVYTFAPRACSSPAGAAIVRVYPKIEPSLTMTLSLDADEAAKEATAKALRTGSVEAREPPPRMRWSTGADATLAYGNRRRELAPSDMDDLGAMVPVQKLAEHAAHLWCEHLATYLGAAIVPDLPRLRIRYGGKLQEIEGTRRVGAEWSLALRASPLLATDAAVDVAGVMIDALATTHMSALGRLLGRARALAASRGQRLRVMLALGGRIEGEASASKRALSRRADPAGSIDGALIADIAAHAPPGSRCIVAFAKQPEVPGATGLRAKLALDNDERGAFLRGSLAMTGCELCHASFASGKVVWELEPRPGQRLELWRDAELLRKPASYVVRGSAGEAG